MSQTLALSGMPPRREDARGVSLAVPAPGVGGVPEDASGYLTDHGRQACARLEAYTALLLDVLRAIDLVGREEREGLTRLAFAAEAHDVGLSRLYCADARLVEAHRLALLRTTSPLRVE